MKREGKYKGNGRKKRNGNGNFWSIKAAAWVTMFLLSVLLTACGGKAQDITDDTGAANRVTEAPEEGIAGTEADGMKENDAGTSADNGGDSGSQETEPPESELPEDGIYASKEDVAYYLSLYGHLPSNFITKKEAEGLGWKGGSLEPFAPGMCIGGSRFRNYEGLLPAKEGRFYTECDIDTLGADKRGAKRIVFSNDGLIYYTEDHYKTFELLYGEE